MRLLVVISITSALVYRAYTQNSLTPLGIVVAVLTAIAHTVHPWSAPFALLIVFFLGGTAVTKVKHDVKARLTCTSFGASGGEGARTHVQVLANSLIASLLVLLHTCQLLARDKSGPASQGCWPYDDNLLVIGIVSNYAVVAADTFSSELGVLSSSKPRLITSPTLRKVPPGTNGGVTITGLLAGFLGSFTIAFTSAVLLPFCKVGSTTTSGKLFRENQPGLQGGTGWGLQEKLAWVGTITLWGGLGSVLDSLLGGWLQASVIDTRTGKAIEGWGGRKVPVSSSFRRSDSTYLRQRVSTTNEKHNKHEDVKITPTEQPNSRRVETGLGVLDSNSINFVVAVVMSIGGMAVASWFWNLPLQSILQI